MTSYFEKLTSINTSSLNLVGAKFQISQQQQSPPSVTDLSSALEKIEQLKNVNTKLELDLKCEHDEKSDLVSLKVGLESDILELREVNERLEFQVEQLKDEKDKIHHVLAKIREDIDKDRNTMFIASSTMSGGVGYSGVMKKFPSLDDLFYPPSSSSPTDSNRATTCVTPTSTHSGQLERIDEIDESLLESLVMMSKQELSQQYSSSSTQQQTTQEPDQKGPVMLDQLMKRIAFLESENEMLRKNYCPKCKKRGKGQSASVIFEHDDEGLVLSAVDDEDDDDDEEERGRMQTVRTHEQVPDADEEKQISVILEMQRKIIEKLEREVFRNLEEQTVMSSRGGIRDELMRMKEELEGKMKAIVRRAREGKDKMSGGETETSGGENQGSAVEKQSTVDNQKETSGGDSGGAN